MGCGTSKQKQEAMDEMDVSKHGAESPSYHMYNAPPVPDEPAVAAPSSS